MNKKEILEFIKNHNNMNLATINSDGFPESRTVVNLHSSDIAPHLRDYLRKNDKIYIMTNTSSPKVSHISNNTKSSVYFADTANFKALLLIGETTEVVNEKTKKNMWHDSWDVYYEGGFKGGDFSILEFTPKRYKYYSNLSVVEEDVKW